jgi:hypothetical protein
MDLVIKNQQLKKRLNNIGQKDWIKLAEKEGLLIVSGNSGSHYINIRDPKCPDPQDIRGLITTLTPNCFKQANIKIFKRFLDFGIEEEKIWKTLGLF